MQAPDQLHEGLLTIRALIREVAPDSVERTDYFQVPGYSSAGYDYEGMFFWLSHKKSSVRLHVKPPVLKNHKSETGRHKQTKSIIEFSIGKELPRDQIRKLVQGSIDVLKKKAL